MISAAQVKAGRRLLGWSQGDLAQNAGVSQLAVARFETIGTIISTQALVIRQTLEEAGVQFSTVDRRTRKAMSEDEILLAAEAEDDLEESD
jgi:predicted transcriptional regulator